MKKSLLILLMMIVFSLTGCGSTSEFTVLVDDVSYEVSFKENDDRSLLDVLIQLDLNELSYEDSEYGAYLTQVGSVKEEYGAYVSLLIDGIPSSVGVESVAFKNKMMVSFELAWYDQDAKMTFDAIHLFLDSMLDDYINEDFVDYQVVQGLYALGQLAECDVIDTYVSSQTPLFLTDYYKLYTLSNMCDLTFPYEVSDFSSLLSSGPYNATYYSYELAAAYFEDMAIDYYEEYSIDESNIAYETLVLDLVSMASLGFDIEAYLMLMQEGQTVSGGYQSPDTEWDGVVYPGAENAATNAMVLYGLVLLGEDITAYTQEEGSLVSALVSYQNEDGSFNWTDEPDLMFSTPQAFRALATLYASNNDLCACRVTNNDAS